MHAVGGKGFHAILGSPGFSRVFLVGLFLTGFATGLGAQRTEERRHLRHILVRSEEQADFVLSELEKGANFKDLARKYSLDTVTKIVGGDLGEQGPVWEPPFNEVAFALENINDVGKAKSSYGWHVIQLLGVKQVEVRGRPTPPPPPQTPKGNEQNPAPDPKTVRGQFNKDLTVSAAFQKIAHDPGEDIRVTIEMTNNLDKPMTIFNPSLWPLGVILRYQFGRLSTNMKPVEEPGQEPEGGFLSELGPGESIRRDYRLQDYTETPPAQWPIIRCIWRGDVLFQRLEKHFPQLQREGDYDTWKARWRYYSTAEQHLNILPRYQPGDRWFALFYVRSFVWVELKDPGVPGLLEHWIQLVRDESYRRVPFQQNVEGEYLVGNMTPEAQKSSAPFVLSSSQSIPNLTGPHPKGTVALALEPGAEGLESRGQMYFCLDSLDEPGVKAIPIGDVFKGLGFLQQTSASFDASSRKPQISLVNVYPLDILPEDVRALVDTPLAERQALDAEDAASVAKKKAERTRPDNPKAQFARDLPRVKFDTDAGSFMVELFEDDTPNTVANFITLAESGFYDGKPFHRHVTADGNSGLVQTGLPDDGTGSGGLEYVIKDEIKRGLKHERGSLAMASVSWLKDPDDPESEVLTKPNTASTQFYICLDEQPQLDGKDTVFGRLVSGDQVVSNLRAGSVIRKVTIVTKRSKPYQVEKIAKQGS